jgi:hypothetical protein
VDAIQTGDVGCPEPRREVAATLVGLDDDDFLEAAGEQADERHRPDRTAAEDADRLSGPRAGDVDPVQADRERLDEGAVVELDPVGQPPKHRRVAGDPLGIAAVVGAEAEAARHRQRDVETVDRGERVDADPVALGPSLDPGTGRGDRPGELVAEHRSLGKHARREHVEVRPADPAGSDVDDDPAFLRRRLIDLADLEGLPGADRDDPHS